VWIYICRLIIEGIFQIFAPNRSRQKYERDAHLPVVRAFVVCGVHNGATAAAARLQLYFLLNPWITITRTVLPRTEPCLFDHLGVAAT
jgi:hypothetical protein